MIRLGIYSSTIQHLPEYNPLTNSKSQCYNLFISFIPHPSIQNESSSNLIIMDITSPQPESPGETSAQGGSGRPATSTNRQYPIPPPYYEYFTDEAWGEYRRQQQRRGNAKGKGILGNDESVGEHVDGDNEDDDDAMIGDKDYQLDAATLEAFTPPRVDWIVEDGGWQAFGQTHTVSKESLLLPLGSVSVSVILMHTPHHIGQASYIHCSRAWYTRLPTSKRRPWVSFPLSTIHHCLSVLIHVLVSFSYPKGVHAPSSPLLPPHEAHLTQIALRDNATRP